MSRGIWKCGLALTLAACTGADGTDDSAPLACGPGTHQVDRRCMPDEAGGGGTGGQETGGSGGAAGEGTDAGTDSSGNCPQSLPGPKLVEVWTPTQKKYCIDATEVTAAQYGEFLNAKMMSNGQYDMSGQPAGCEDNLSYDGAVGGDFPASNMDWCDAYMFCQYAGKHLCGAVGGGELVGFMDRYDPAKNEWYNACSSGGKHAYAYGDEYDRWACNGHDFGEDKALAVPAVSSCHGPEAPFDAIFDMSGNVWEWLNLSGNGEKVIAGGSYFNDLRGTGVLACINEGMQDTSWDFRSPMIGFRCCASEGN